MSTEIKKMKQGMSYSLKEKTIILNVFKYFKIQFPDKCVTELVRRTAEATGCSEKSVFQFRKEEASVEGFKIPSKTKTRKSININSRDVKYNDSIRQAIKNIVYDLKYKNVNASLNTILKNVHENSELPNFSVMTLRRLLFDMGFSYEKRGNKPLLIEKPQEVPEKSKNKKNKTQTQKLPLKTKPQKANTSQQPIMDMQCAPEPTLHVVPHPINHNHTHMSQTLDYQNHSRQLLPMQPQQNYNHNIMGPPMHSQPSLHRNMPIILNHQRAPHQPHLVTPYDMHMRRDEMVMSLDMAPQCL